ncbi:MAG: hypothetical protein PUD43_05235 [Clostridia bacterium]|nr:hypothetical protein [Clostridia bacterium]
MTAHIHTEPYLNHYRTNIMSRLEAIDLLIKTKPSPYDRTEVSDLLGIPRDELDRIAAENSISSITPQSLAVIMKNGSGELCGAFRRELECGLTDTYTPEQISYIYNIDIDDVLNACASMGVCRLHRGLLETLFSTIYI